MARNISLETEITVSGITITDKVYGLIGKISYNLNNTWHLEIENNCIGFTYPEEFASRQAAEFVALAFVYELEATGH